MERNDMIDSALNLYHEGQHRHLCPVCDQSWWHDDQPEVECERVWVLDCPIDIGLDRSAA